MIKAVFLDIDGTLVDSNGFHILAWDAAIQDEGLHVPRARIAEQIGKGGDMLLPTLFPGIAPDLCKRLSDAHGRIFAKRYLHRVKPFPSSKQLIERLARAGVKIILASSAQRSEVTHYGALLDIGCFLSGMVSADDVRSSKPAADIFALTLKIVTPIAAEEAIVIADTPYDIQSASKSQIRTIGVRSGGFSDRALEGAVGIYDDVKALMWIDLLATY